jgi:hypothetical protein
MEAFMTKADNSTHNEAVAIKKKLLQGDLDVPAGGSFAKATWIWKAAASKDGL